MSLAEEIDYTDNVRPITGVKFGILSPIRMMEMSVAEIYKPITQNDTLDSTLLDPRLGPRDKGDINQKSGLDSRYDPGNFGHMVLAKPIIQIKMLDQIINTLNAVCYKCSTILIDKDNVDALNALKAKKGKARFRHLVKMRKSAKKVECHNCGQIQPKFGKGKDRNRAAQVMATFAKDEDAGQSDKKQQPFNQEECYQILNHISMEDTRLMGYDPELSYPSWMIWTIMPIPPPTMRPSVRMENGQSAEDDLTQILNDIIKTNAKLLKLLNKGEEADKKIPELWNLLQLQVAAYIDNEQSSIDRITNRSGRPLKTLRSRIKAKQGRIRSNLMGKRVDFTARSVITPDPNISIDQLGIPKRVAMILDYKEIVSTSNIHVLNQLVQNGPDNWPGANSVRRKRAVGGKKGGGNKSYVVNLKYIQDRSTVRLRPGDVVYRHLMDDDWVFFNRQPSLHKMSMMAHRAKILKQGDTFRLNVSVTTPYNADQLPSRSATVSCLLSCLIDLMG